jgi:hypothetical protein
MYKINEVIMSIQLPKQELQMRHSKIGKKNQLEFIFNAEYITGRQTYQLIRVDQLAFSVAVTWIKHFLKKEEICFQGSGLLSISSLFFFFTQTHCL